MDLTAEDRSAIQDLLTKYTFALDQGRELETLLTVFTEDAILSGPGGNFVGHDGIRSWVERGQAVGLEHLKAFRHVTSNVLITGTTDRAQVDAYFVTVTLRPEVEGGRTESPVRQFGTYRCFARKDGQAWRLTHRDVTVTDFSTST